MSSFVVFLLGFIAGGIFFENVTPAKVNVFQKDFKFKNVDGQINNEMAVTAPTKKGGFFRRLFKRKNNVKNI